MIFVLWYCNLGIYIWDKEEDILLILFLKYLRKYVKLIIFIILFYEEDVDLK